VYFYDPNVPPQTQAIKIEVVHSGRPRPLLFVNGRTFTEPPVASNIVMTSWMVQLEKGPMSLEVIDDAAVDLRRAKAVRHIEVR
jgi:hypothetical protein